jgi:hypothetical protein
MITKFYKYELRILIKAIEFYIDVFRSDIKSIDDLETLKKLKERFEKGLEV